MAIKCKTGNKNNNICVCHVLFCLEYCVIGLATRSHQTLLKVRQGFTLWHTDKHNSMHFPHQSATAKQNHKDDEGLKPAVLHYVVARLSQQPPFLPHALFSIHLTARELLDTAWKTK